MLQSLIFTLSGKISVSSLLNLFKIPLLQKLDNSETVKINAVDTKNFLTAETRTFDLFLNEKNI